MLKDKYGQEIKVGSKIVYVTRTKHTWTPVLATVTELMTYYRWRHGYETFKYKKEGTGGQARQHLARCPERTIVVG